MTLGNLSGNPSFPNSKMRDLDLVTFKCHFRDDISQLLESTGQGWEKEGCQENLMRRNERSRLCERKQNDDGEGCADHGQIFEGCKYKGSTVTVKNGMKPGAHIKAEREAFSYVS